MRTTIATAPYERPGSLLALALGRAISASCNRRRPSGEKCHQINLFEVWGCAPLATSHVPELYLWLSKPRSWRDFDETATFILRPEPCQSN